MSSSKSLNLALMSEALAVREMLSTKSYDKDEIVHLTQNFYSKSNPEHIQRSVEACLPNFPRGCCDFASLLLQDRIQDGEVTTGVYYKRPRAFDAHAFLQLGGILCDLTADQFGGPRIYIGEFVLPWALKPYSWERGPFAKFENWPSPEDSYRS